MKNFNQAKKYSALPIAPRALNEYQAGAYIGKSVHWMRDCRIGRSAIPGPPWTKIGRSVVYLIEDLNQWLDSFKQSA